MTRRTDRRKEADIFGAAVRKRRESAGLFQERLTEAAGMSQRYLPAIELGDNSHSLTAIFQLCEALGVTPAGLLGGCVRRR